MSDANTGVLLGGVGVQLTPTGYSQVTGSDGTFQFDNLDVQEYTLTFTRLGYETYKHKVTVKPGLSSSVQVSLKVAEVSMPTLVAGNATSLTTTSATLHATLTSLGNSQVSQHGFCWSRDMNPDVSDERFVIKKGLAGSTGEFWGDLSGLEPDTEYHWRAFATNSAGTAYSEDVLLKTPSNGSGGGGGNDSALKSGLMAWYTFDSGDISDSSDYDVDGVPVNNPSFIEDTPSGSGKALFLNSVKEQFVNIGYNLFKGLASYSIALWLKDFSTGSIVSGINTNYEPNCFPRLYLGDDGKLKFASSCRSVSNSPTFSFNCSSLQSGAWHHVAVTCSSEGNGSSTLNLYIDGTLTDSITSYWNDNSSYNVTKVQIGGNGDGFYPVYSSMKADNVRLYNRCLSKEDVKSIYNAEK